MPPLRPKTRAEKEAKAAASKKVWLDGEKPAKKKKRTAKPPVSTANPRGLKKPEWRALTHAMWSRIVKARAGNRCALCGSDYRLNAHHMIHNQRCGFLRYDLANGLSLCFPCHNRFHFVDSQDAWEYMRVNRPHDYAYVLAHKRDPAPKLSIAYYRDLVENFERIIGRESLQ